MDDANTLLHASARMGRARLVVMSFVTLLGGVGAFDGFSGSGNSIESLPLLAIYCLALVALIRNWELPATHGTLLGLGLAMSSVSFIALSISADAAIEVVTNFMSVLGKLFVAGVFNVPMIVAGIAGRITFAKGRQEKFAFYLSCLITLALASLGLYLSWWGPW
jgi:hypothetical protein